MLELPPDVETRLREKAARHGQDITDYLRQIADEETCIHPGTAENLDRPREADPSYLRSLPKDERDRLYEADLALPVEQRELTAWL